MVVPHSPACLFFACNDHGDPVHDGLTVAHVLMQIVPANRAVKELQVHTAHDRVILHVDRHGAKAVTENG